MSATHFTIPEFNLLAAWVGLWLGFVSGLAMGSKFHQDEWLGGYGSWRRRLYRLGHISFFGLAVVNWMFHGTARWAGLDSSAATIAGWTLLVGAFAMPLCCGIVAHWRCARFCFAVPVLSLLTGSTLTLWSLLNRHDS